jgi:hypothetical protein
MIMRRVIMLKTYAKSQKGTCTGTAITGATEEDEKLVDKIHGTSARPLGTLELRGELCVP